jgi:SPP1 gp7 family putative phage head morphogenesis protein
MPTKQQQIINQDLQISAFLGRYDPETVKKYTETLKRIAKNAVTTLSGATDALSFAESSRLLESIRMEFTRLGDMTQANLVKDLQEVVGTQYQATSSMMVKLFPEVEVSAVVATNMPRDAFLAATDTEKEITVWSGGKKKTYTAYDEVRRITRTTVQSFERIVGEGILKGVGNRDIMKTLEKDLGIRESVAVAQIQAVARTIIAEGMEEAKNEAFKNFAPVIKGWMWNSVLDNRTSLGCASLNGKVVKKRSELPKLPRHFNCRATCSPVTDFDDVDTIIQRYHLRNKSMVERDGGANETVFKNKKTEKERAASLHPISGLMTCQTQRS